MNHGISALIGNARKNIGKELGDNVPIIGFPLWSDIKNRDNLKNDDKNSKLSRVVNMSSKSYNNYNSNEKEGKNQLEPNHTHLLLYDHESEGTLDKYRLVSENYTNFMLLCK